MAKVLSRLLLGDVAFENDGKSFRELKVASPYPKRRTVITFATNSNRSPAVRLTKLDDAPLTITWEKSGQADTFTDAGAVTSISSAVISATASAPSTVTIESEGPWLAGCDGLPLISGKDSGQWPHVYPEHIHPDPNCVGVSQGGFGFRFNDGWPAHKLVIPRYVTEFTAGACVPYNLTYDTYIWCNVEVEFESATPPAVEVPMFSAKSPPVRIIVPASGLTAYATNANFAPFVDILVGKKSFSAGDKLTEHHSGYFYETEWYSDAECTVPVVKAESDGVYYCKLIGSVQKTVITYAESTKNYIPTFRLTKMDDAPMYVSWGQTNEQYVFTEAGAVTCAPVGDATASASKPGIVTIVSFGKWMAGADEKPLLHSNGMHVKEIILDSNCVGVLPYGAGVRFKKNYLTPHKIFIPSSVELLRENALAPYQFSSVSNDWQSTELEFEAAEPPVIAGELFRSTSLPDRIIVPVEGLVTYMNDVHLARWAHFLVGKATFAAGAELPDYSTPEYPTCTWYSDPECTTVVTTADADGAYYCKLTAYMIGDGFYEGPLSLVDAFIASRGFGDVECMVDFDGMQSSVLGADLVAHFTSLGLTEQDIVRFEFPN